MIKAARRQLREMPLQRQTFLDSAVPSAKHSLSDMTLTRYSERLRMSLPKALPILTVLLCFDMPHLFTVALPNLLHEWLPAGNMVGVDEETAGTDYTRQAVDKDSPSDLQ
jgi:hypothetical protein